MTNHIVNVTSELRGLRRCFKSRYNVARALEEIFYSRDARWDGRMSGTRRMRRGASRRDIPEEEAASWSQVAGNHGNYMRRKKISLVRGSCQLEGKATEEADSCRQDHWRLLGVGSVQGRGSGT